MTRQKCEICPCGHLKGDACDCSSPQCPNAPMDLSDPLWKLRVPIITVTTKKKWGARIGYVVVVALLVGLAMLLASTRTP